ncbi:MAG TPA: EAL domain-containing protein [Methylophilaceae bacterium]|jgi:diguanylate cyclase (GGDEF)-like protein
MQSGFIHRTLLLLALLITAFASVYYFRVGEVFDDRKQALLKQDSIAFKQALQERIRVADEALDLVARDPHAASQLQITSPYFSSVNYVDDNGKVTPLNGVQLNLPDQTEAIRIHLMQGEPAMLVLHAPEKQARVILMRGLGNNEHGVLTAELAPAYLWHFTSQYLATPNSSSLHVIDTDGQVLYSTDMQDSQGVINARLKSARTLSGKLNWNDNKGLHQANYLTLPIHQHYASNDWIVAEASPPSTFISEAGLWDWIMLGIVTLSVLLAWAVTLRIRKSLQPETTYKHQGQPLHENVHPMAIVHAMDEIDRAILSNANFSSVIEMVLTHGPELIPCTIMALTQFDASAEGRGTTSFNNAGGISTIELPLLDKDLKQTLESEPDGCLVENAATIPFLKPLSDFGASKIQLLPVYREGELSAILYFGLTETTHLAEGDQRLARSFADRLGVALTSVTRGKELYIQEHFDTVTGLPNRSFCRDRLSQEISRARRKQLLVGVLHINLSGFKKVNDSLGYAGGDFVLNEVAQRLKTVLRESDLVSRFGNDEFVILLPDIKNANEISKVSEKVVGSFGPGFTYEGQTTHLSANVGITIYPDDGQNIDDLLHYAEMAMSRIKASGHSQYAFYEEHMNSKAIERLKLEHDLRLALTEDQLFLVYQPQIDLRTGKIAGVEALVRWQHPTRGLISPIDFISLAEETGMIIKMSEIIRHTACKQFVEWTEKGVAPPRIAVNVSSQDLKRATFTDELMATLQQYGVPPAAIELEITESMFVDASGGIVDVLRNLQSIGFLIAIDDFGTGYSSLSYLSLLPFDILKVDRSFVLGIGKASEKIVAVIVDMAHNFDKAVIAEGVDSEHQHKYLVDLGCEIIQGYLFSKPLMPLDFEVYSQKTGVVTTH